MVISIFYPIEHIVIMLIYPRSRLASSVGCINHCTFEKIGWWTSSVQIYLCYFHTVSCIREAISERS